MSNKIPVFAIFLVFCSGIRGIFVPSVAMGATDKTEILPTSKFHEPLPKEVSKGNNNLTPFYGYLRLAGTMFVSGKSHRPKEAVLENLLTKQKTRCTEKTVLPFGVHVKEILQDRIILEKDGHLKELSLRDRSQYQQQINKLRKQGYLKVGSQEWVVDAHGLFGNSKDIIDLVLKSGLQFQTHQGKSLIKVGETAKDSKLANLGFASGDQLLSVNEVDLNGSIGLYNSYAGIRKTEKVSIKILRNNKVQTLSYWVATKGKVRYNMEKVFNDPAIMKLLLSSTELH